MRRSVVLGALVCLSVSSVFAQGRQAPGAIFERSDANGDGVVSREEFTAAQAAQFGSRDRNSDGFIDSADLGEQAAARPRIGQAANAMITQFDTDKDGKLSKDEFVKSGLRLFDQVDADKNATLDAKELEAARSTLQGRGRRR